MSKAVNLTSAESDSSMSKAHEELLRERDSKDFKYEVSDNQTELGYGVEPRKKLMV